MMWWTTNTITVFQFQEETGQFQGDKIVSAQEQSKAVTFFKVVNKLWVLDAGSTKALHPFFFHCLRLAQSIIFSKRLMMSHTVWVLFLGHVLGWQWALCTHYKAHIVHNKIQKCIWATPACVWAPPNTSWTCKRTIRKK